MAVVVDGRKVLAGVVLAGVAVFAAGCGSAGSSGSSGSSGAVGGSSGVVTQSAEAAALASLGETPDSLVLPLSPYFPGDQQFNDLIDMRTQLISRCLRGAGFNVQLPIHDESVQEKDGMDPGRGTWYDFGITSMSLAERYGYHALNPVNAPKPTSAERAKARAEQAKARADRKSGKKPVLTAEQKQQEACSTQVDSESGYVKWDGNMRVQNLAIGAWQKANAEPGMLAAFKKWSACMAAKGFDYSTPLNAQIERVGDSAALGWNTSTATGAEIQAATTDVTCKQKTGLLAKWIKAIVAQQDAVLEPNLPQLRADMATFQSVYSAEQRLLAAGK